jgi:AcrR family transcriptional regulator
VFGVTSLRERKKAETRQRIADTATMLFIQRGFDEVTVAEIAEGAGVSKVTVFNYFPRKEDMFFDRLPQAEELLTGAVRDREPGESPLSALRRLFVRQAEQHHPIAGYRDTFHFFWNTVIASSTLRARAREAFDGLQAAVARTIAETSDESDPDLTAALAFAIIRTTYTAGIARMMAGGNAEETTRDHIAALHQAFDTLAMGLR